MGTVICPLCHGRGEIPVADPRDTTKMKPDELEAIITHAVRTPLPSSPVILPPKVIVDPDGRETMPDAGWLQRHLREQMRARRRRTVLYALAFVVLLVLIGTVSFCLQKQS